MKENRYRTVNSIIGILICFVLLFGVLTAGFGYWDYIIQQSYDGRTQLFTDDECTKEMVEKLSRQEQVKTLDIEQYGEISEEDEDRELTVDSLKEGRQYGAHIGLQDTSDIKKSAEQLTEATGIELYIDESALVVLGQAKAEGEEFYHAILSLIVAVFCAFSIVLLRNLMTISVVERMRDYGLLRCVGMSKKQLNVLLLAEGMVMSGTAMVGGIVFAYGFIQVVGYWLNQSLLLDSPIHFPFYWSAFGITVLLNLGVTLFSLLEPARQAGLLSPIDALHNNVVLRGKRGHKKLHYYKGRLWGRLFGITGEYAYKNMMRTRGRQINLFVGVFVCVCLMGCMNSYTDSLRASVRYFYEGKHRKYAESITCYEDYDAEKAQKLQDDISKLHGVKETGLTVSSTSWDFYDEKLMKASDAAAKRQHAFRCVSYGYDDADLKALEPYLIDGRISVRQMAEEHGVIICDTGHHVVDDYGGRMDQRYTDYQVGDKISQLSFEGRQKKMEILHQIVPEVNRKLGKRKDKDLYESVVTEKQYRILWNTIRRVLTDEGFDISSLPEKPPQKAEEANRIYDMMSEVGRILFEQGYRDECVVLGIVSEDIHNGGNIEEMFGWYPYLEIIYPQQQMIKDIWQRPTKSEQTKYYFINGWDKSWGIGVKRDINQLDDSLEKYCQGQEELYYSGGDFLEQYIDMLELFRVVRAVGLSVCVCIVTACLFQVFNLVSMNMALRQKELWLYEIVGMTLRQKIRMVLLENSLPGLIAIVLGIVFSYGLSWYFVDYLLNQDQGLKFSFPVLQNMSVGIGFFLLIMLASILGIVRNRKCRT